MSITLNLPPDMEARLQEEAARYGQDAAEYVKALVEDKLRPTARRFYETATKEEWRDLGAEVVGHEPTMTQLALGLTDPLTTNAAAAERISAKFPTSAIAVLRLNGSWADLELGSAQLADFHVPR